MEHMTFKEKTANMNRRQKISYILYYYKYHFIIGILIIASITWFTIDRLNQKQTVLDVSFIGNVMDTNKLEQLNNDATDALVSNKNKQETLLQFMHINYNSTDQETSANVQKLVAQLSAGELDVMIMPEKLFTSYSKQAAFDDVAYLKNKAGFENLNYVQAKGYKNKIGTYGINLSSLKIFKKLSYDTSEKLILAIPSNSKNKTLSIKFIKWLINKNSL